MGFWITCFWFAVIAKLKEFLIDIIDLGPAEVAHRANVTLLFHHIKERHWIVMFSFSVLCVDFMP